MDWWMRTLIKIMHTRLTAVFLTAAGIMLSITVCASFRHVDNQRIDAEFKRRSTLLATALRRVIEARLATVHTLAAFHAASDDVRRDEFRTFAASILANVNSIQALEWVPRVADAERAAYEAAARAEGYPEFRITERNPAGELVPASRRAEYFPVYFLEPYPGNEPALGFDLASNTTRRAAMETARDSGRPVATEQLRLVQADGDRRSFLVLLPAYRNARPHHRIDDRRANLSGYYLAAFRIAEMVEATLVGVHHDDFDFVLADRDAAAEDAILFQKGEWTTGAFRWPVYEQALDVAGRAWILQCHSTRAFLAGQRRSDPWIALFAGLGFTTLLSVLLIGSARHTERIERSEGKLQKAVAGMQVARREADLLDGVMQRINEGVGLAQVLDHVFDSFDSVIPFDRIGCAMIEEEHGLVRSRWARSKTGNQVIDTDYAAPLAGSSLQSIVTSGTPRIICDLEAYLHNHPQSASTRLMIREGIRSSLTCPLIATGRAVGFLFFSSGQRDTYRKEHVQTFMRIANQLSLTLQKGQLFDEVGHELHKSQERFALAVHGTDAGIWDWDVTAGRVYFSPRWKSMLGYADDEIEGRFEEWEARLHPEERERALAAIHDYLDGRSSNYELEHRLRHKNGTYRWIIARGAAVYDALGKPYRMVGSHIDVTDRKLAEESLRQNHAHLLAAQKIQEHLLPKAPPAIPGLDIAGACYPSYYTAGDYFDYLVMEDGSLVVVIADVMGHGFGPALVAATIHACLQTVTGSSLGIDSIAARLNHMVCQTTESGRFVTLFLGRLDPRTLSLQYVNAGHPPGYVIDASGSVRAALDSLSPPLGLDPQAEFPIGDDVCLAAGDLLLLMTDGIAETLSPDDAQFGAQRALELVIANRSMPARELIAAIRDATLAFAQRHDSLDDLTAVVLKIDSAALVSPRDSGAV